MSQRSAFGIAADDRPRQVEPRADVGRQRLDHLQHVERRLILLGDGGGPLDRAGRVAVLVEHQQDVREAFHSSSLLWVAAAVGQVSKGCQ